MTIRAWEEVEVLSCDDCPFLQHYEDGNECEHPTIRELGVRDRFKFEDERRRQFTPPALCPLRSVPSLVILK